MSSALIVARMQPESCEQVAKLFADFDQTEMPHMMGTRRRQLFHYQGLYFHLQDFDREGGESIEAAREHPLFLKISDDLKPFIGAFDPVTWRGPKDALASNFYDWGRPA